MGIVRFDTERTASASIMNKVCCFVAGLRSRKCLSLLCALLLFSSINCNTSAIDDDREEAPKKTVILAIDGGGIKGVVPATFLQAIEAAMKKPSYQLFDLIGGTSTGGIISVALTSANSSNSNKLPFTADEIVKIYQNDGSDIFVAQGCVIETCAKYYADHNGKGIEPYLQKMLGLVKLKDNFQYVQGLSNARVKQMFTTTYIVNSTGGSISQPVRGQDYGPYLFNWYDSWRLSRDDYYTWEAARGTSAAPTYFPIANVGGGTSPRSAAAEKWVIDGGTMSNDPVVWGISEALRTGLTSRLEDMIVISLGTGLYPGNAGVGINNEGYLVPSKGNWSDKPWVVEDLYDLEGAENDAGTLINIILDAVQMVSNSQLSALQKSGLKYYRLEPTLTKAQSTMDNTSAANIASLIKTANDYLSNEGATTFANIIAALQSEQ